MKKRIPLYLQIIIGMVAGVAWGMIAVKFDLGKINSDWIKPWGVIFLNLLKLIAVPLVFISLVKGIYGLEDMGRLRSLGFKTLGLFVITTVFSALIGLGLVNAIRPGDSFPKEKQVEFQAKYNQNVTAKQTEASQIRDQSPLQFIVDMVPENIFKASTDNSKMLQIILFALLFGIAMLMLPISVTEPVISLFDSLNHIILKLIDIIMALAPYGVFALLGSLIIDFSGDIGVFTSLGIYFITVVIGLLLILGLLYPLFIKLFVRKARLLRFFRGMLPAQMVAFSTSSSAATLPVNMKQATEKIGVHEEVAEFVLPVGVTINMNGTSCYQAVAAVFIAQVYGLDLSIGQQIIIVLTALLASIGSPGVPGGSIVMLIIVLTSAGIPVEGLAMILGIDRPLDMLRTVANITGDTATAVMVAKTENLLDESKLCEK